MCVHAAKQSRSLQVPVLARVCQDELYAFLLPLLSLLNRSLDVRLLRTFLATTIAIVQHRHRNHALLLSELGGYLSSPEQAPAGTKRLDRLLRSPAWSAQLVSDWLWQRAVDTVSSCLAAGQQPFLIWDTSVLEKPETLACDDLCAVRSSKARRLMRIRPCFYNPPPTRPICVAGLHWLGLVVVSALHPPTLACLHWSTSRGEHACPTHELLDQLLTRCVAQWGRSVWHIWDRGFASRRWLQPVLEHNLRFVVRWKKGNHLLDRWGEKRLAWQHTRGKRSWSTRQVRDSHTRQVHTIGVLAVPVNVPSHARPLWMVVARSGKGREPWYLLTSEQICSADEAWTVVFAYARRWQIERVWRYSKSELGMESIRVRSWERREKLLMLATLVEAFLLSLLQERLKWLRTQVLRLGCHRTGKRNRECPAPLYRLRIALARLWLAVSEQSRL